MRDKLKRLRVSHKFTQQVMADKIQINRSTYTNIENGKKNPSFLVAKKIKDILGHKEDDIFFE